jgi:hypothetical protein
VLDPKGKSLATLCAQSCFAMHPIISKSKPAKPARRKAAAANPNSPSDTSSFSESGQLCAMRGRGCFRWRRWQCRGELFRAILEAMERPRWPPAASG